jgi:hypothetical protein
MKGERELSDIIERVSLFIIITLAMLIVIMVNATKAKAHDQWANGAAIPSWVKSSCCGPADAHHLKPEQVTRDGDYYHVVGYDRSIPVAQALPSQDGDYWIFYKDDPAGDYYSPEGGKGHHEASQSGVYCFFVPMAF